MDFALASIPFKYAKLIMGFTHNRLSETEADELDRWLEEGDENVEIFEELTHGVDDNVFSPDELIIETDDLLDYWMIAGLIARQMQGVLEENEKGAGRLAAGVTKNEEFYRLLCDKANLQKFVTWLKR